MMDSRVPRLEGNVEAHSPGLVEEKRRHNGLTLVARLPAELLSYIFFLCLDFMFKLGNGPREYYPLFVITGVCHHWREVALASPRLWCCIDVTECSPLSFVETLLSRSQNHHLDVAFIAEGVDFDGFDAIFARINRIHTLCLSCGEEYLRRITSQHAPLLRELEMFAPGDGGCTIEQLEEACRMSPLEELWIMEYIVPWNSNIFRPTLTKLSLEDATPPEEQLCSKLLHVLTRLPLLEELNLTGVLLDDPREEIPSSQTAYLPRLHLLRISAPPSSVAQLLNHLILPTSTALSLTCDPGTANGLEDLLVAVSDKWTSNYAIGPPANLRSASLRYLDEKWHILECYNIPHIMEPNCENWTFQLYFQVNSEDGGLDSGTLEAILRALSLLKLNALRLCESDCAPADVDTWFAYFAAVNDLQELHLTREWGNETLALVLAAQLPVAGSSASESLSPLFPRLRKLHLKSVAELYDKGQDYEYITPIDNWVGALQARAAAGMALEELTLEDCTNMRLEAIGRLSAYVAVRWDAKMDDDDGVNGTDDNELDEHEQDEEGDKDDGESVEDVAEEDDESDEDATEDENTE